MGKECWDCKHSTASMAPHLFLSCGVTNKNVYWDYFCDKWNPIKIGSA